MRASDLGYSVTYLREHQYCMSNELTREERGVVLNHIEKLVDTRGPEWSFNRSQGPNHVVAQLGGIVLNLALLNSEHVEIHMTEPAMIFLNHPGEPRTRGLADQARRIADKLHCLRHQNGNHITRKLETAGISFAGLRGAQYAAALIDDIIEAPTPANHAPRAQPDSVLSPSEQAVEQMQSQIDNLRTTRTRRLVRDTVGMIALAVGLFFGIQAIAHVVISL